MKKFLFGIALLGTTSTFALAADLPSRRAPPVYVPPMVAPVFTWTGLYAGINAGYAFDGNTSDRNNGPAVAVGLATPYARTRSDGFTGGGQIGYNMQLGGGIPVIGQLGGFFGNGGTTGGVVIGVEADAAYTDLRGNYNDGVTALSSRTNYVGTARGRLGYAFGDLLIFGTGGFAYGGVRTGVANGFAGVAGSDSIRTGYAYGGGVEYAIPTTSFVNFFHSSAVTLKAEFIHYDLGSQNLLVGAPGTVGSFNSRIKTDGNLVRAGINYKLDLFGAPAAPVVARY